LPEAYKVTYTTPSVHFPKAIAICKILHKTSDLATAVKLNTYRLWISFCFWPCTWLTITQYTQSTAHVWACFKRLADHQLLGRTCFTHRGPSHVEMHWRVNGKWF